MLNFHGWLDVVFKKKVSFSIFLRIWLTLALLIVVACGLVLYYAQKTVRPSAKRVVEDSLVDTSRLLAMMVADDVARLDKDALYQALDDKLAQAFADPKQLLWYHQKQKSTHHLYITDHQGTVIYDSRKQSVGADFSRWNDVYLTLQGKYGARSTEIDGHSVMYVASPIVKDGRLIGVLSVGKPTITLTPYLDKSTQELVQIVVSIMVSILLASVLMAWWLRHSIQTVNRYTQGLAKEIPPHFYLGRELNELVVSIEQMKHVIENKAYVTNYVHTLTHELKSPLTAIRASAEILTDDLTADEKTQFTDIILTQTDKLTALVDKLLSLAKIEQPNFKLDSTTIDIDEMIESCLALKSANIKQLHKTVITKKSGAHLLADEFWLTQAILNLIDNAMYYGKTTIKISTKQDNKHTTITVMNDCDVLDEFIINKAFDRYFSVGNHSYQKGTGLGLSLVKQVVERHGGVVTFTQGGDDTDIADPNIASPNAPNPNTNNTDTTQNWVKVQMALPNAK